MVLRLPDLPQEILMQVFLKLPTKSIGRCRCLSKTWRARLSSPQFIKLHLSQRPQDEKLVLMTPHNTIRTITSITDDTLSTNLDLGFNDYWDVFSGSCDGLVLFLTNDDDMVFVVNPTTMESLTIPISPQALDKGKSLNMYGFGYDSLHDDYKIVTLSYFGRDIEDIEDVLETFVDVYSLNSGAWRRIEASPYDHSVPEQLESGAYVNGSIHWLASNQEPEDRLVIAAFDLSEEEFDEIPAPNTSDSGKYGLTILGGCLCMYFSRRNGPMDVWIMKEYGDLESWTKFSVGADYELALKKPLCYIGDDGDDEIVFVTKVGNLAVYNQKEKTMRDMLVDGGHATFVSDACSYVESLMSPPLGYDSLSE